MAGCLCSKGSQGVSREGLGGVRRGDPMVLPTWPLLKWGFDSAQMSRNEVVGSGVPGLGESTVKYHLFFF